MEPEQLKGKPWNPDKEKILQGIFGNSALLNLYHLANKGIVWELFGEINRGKEAGIFPAKTKNGEWVAVKIYKQIHDFNMTPYIKGDPRFRGLSSLRLIDVWARKEFRNLMAFDEMGIRVPRPITVRGNVLVMEFIGKNYVPAPTYNESPPNNPAAAFKKIIKFMMIAHQHGLVHGDLSQFNIMDFHGPVIIDCGQAVIRRHPRYMEFLERDIANILKYFEKRGVQFDKGEARKYILGECDELSVNSG